MSPASQSRICCLPIPAYLLVLLPFLLLHDGCSAGEAAPPAEADTSSWGEPVRGLQSGVRILPGEDGKPHQGAYCFGDEIRLEFRLRNVSEKLVCVEEFRPFPLYIAVGENAIGKFWNGKDDRPLSTSVKVLWPTTEFVAAVRTVVIGAPGGRIGIRSTTRTILEVRPGRGRIAVQHVAPFMDKTSWNGRIASGKIPLEITDDAEVRKKGAMRMLERELDSFRLHLGYWGGRRTVEGPVLWVSVNEKSPGRGEQRTFLQISKEQAKTIVDYPGTTDFYPEALKDDRLASIFADEHKKEPQLVLSVRTGDDASIVDREEVWLSLPVTVEMAVKHIEALRSVLDKESVRLLNRTIQDFTVQAGGANPAP